jgi:hypothetical protein
MKRRNGEIEWTVKVEVRDGATVHVLRFERQASGPHTGQYHPYFWMLPGVFLSQFIESHYEHWEAWLGEELLDSSVVYKGTAIATKGEVERKIFTS